MTSAKNCKDQFEDIVALVLGVLDPSAADELQKHIARCERCRAARDSLVEEEKFVRSGFEALAGSLGSIEQTVHQELAHPSSVRITPAKNHFSERIKNMIRAHKRLIAAAAVLLAILVPSVFFNLPSPLTTGYALAQTVEANNTITSYHITLTPVKGHVAEAWIQLDQAGNMLARMDFPDTEDGPKVTIVSGDRAEVWFKGKNMHAIIADPGIVKELLQSRVFFDPKQAFEQLQKDIAADKVSVETKEPEKEGDPITLSVTSKKHSDRKQVYEVDPKTKLVQRLTDNNGPDGKTVVVNYLDYNQPIDSSVFQLVLPNDIVTIDQINNVVGMEKGDLSDNEISVKVVREFFEALIAEDYQKAGQLYEGIPAAALKKLLGEKQVKFLRIVEVGLPAPAPNPKMKAIQVPIKVEVEAKGKKVVEQFTPFVRQVYKQQGRWGMCGGF
jgi:outer membrane lipoprotein-sorting protein